MQKEFQKVPELLKQAEQAAQHGEREKAYQFGLQATSLAPRGTSRLVSTFPRRAFP